MVRSRAFLHGKSTREPWHISIVFHSLGTMLEIAIGRAACPPYVHDLWHVGGLPAMTRDSPASFARYRAISYRRLQPGTFPPGYPYGRSTDVWILEIFRKAVN